MTLILIIISLGYVLIMLDLSLETLTFQKTIIDDKAIDYKTEFSVLVNYRNEREYLPYLLNSISQLKYDWNQVEFIFINDDSSDDSTAIVNHFKEKHPHIDITLINRTEKSVSAKKDGITQAIAIVKHEHIICTDADCILPQRWLETYDIQYQSSPDIHFIAAPVELMIDNSFIHHVQHNEMTALQMVTIGAFSTNRPFLCNGANLSFTKNAFIDVNGYHGNLHISSGDDVFLLEKLVRLNRSKCTFLKSKHAIVKTFPKNNWHALLEQRVRWAQKGKSTNSVLNKLLSVQVLLMNLAFITTPFLWFADLVDKEIFIAVWMVKILTDMIVLFIGNRFFKNRKWHLYFIPQLMLYPILLIIIAIKSWSHPQWKSRTTHH